MKIKRNNHHVIPRSRVQGKPVMGVCEVPAKAHDLYHQLFGNMKPGEIVNHLNKTFWGDRYLISFYPEEEDNDG